MTGFCTGEGSSEDFQMTASVPHWQAFLVHMATTSHRQKHQFSSFLVQVLTKNEKLKGSISQHLTSSDISVLVVERFHKYTLLLAQILKIFVCSDFRQACKSFISLSKICTQDIAILSPFNLHLLASGFLSAARHQHSCSITRCHLVKAGLCQLILVFTKPKIFGR